MANNNQKKNNAQGQAQTPVAPPQPAPLVPAQPAATAEQAKEAAEKAAQVTQQTAQQAAQAAEKVTKGLQEMLKPAGGQPKVTSDERMWAGISYIPLVALVALLMKPQSAYVKLHGRQGLLVFLVFFFAIFLYLIPFIGPLLGGLIQLAMVVIGLFSMYQAFVGNWWKIPVFGDLAEQIPIDFFTKVTTEALTGQRAPQAPPAEEQPVETTPPAAEAPPIEPPAPVSAPEQKPQGSAGEQPPVAQPGAEQKPPEIPQNPPAPQG